MNNISIRYHKMEDFLQYWKQIIKENPNLSFDDSSEKNMVYHELIRLGVSNSDRTRDLSLEGVFDHWINRFKKTSNLSVFVNPDRNYFCHFQNQTEKFDRRVGEAIKVYIPLDRDHIEHGAEMIFSYLASKNIAHLSKVGKCIRFDDIVVRLSNEEDAKELLSFVNNQPYLKEGKISPNPFSFQFGDVAMACDRRKSYTNTIFQFLIAYFQHKITEKKVDDIQLNDFIQFAYSYYDQYLCNPSFAQDVIKQFEISDSENSLQSNREHVNVREIVKLFLDGMWPGFSLEDYFKTFREHSLGLAFEEQVKQSQENRKQKENANFESFHTNDLFSLNQFLLQVVFKMSEKYGTNHSLELLNAYIQTGNVAYLTRTNGIRNQVSSSNFREVLLKFLEQKQLSLSNYYCMVRTEEDKRNYLDNSLISTFQKYERKYRDHNGEVSGKRQAIVALQKLISEGNYNGFTRDNNIRANLLANVSVKDAKSIVTKRLGLPDSVTMDSRMCWEVAENYFSLLHSPTKENTKGNFVV